MKSHLPRYPRFQNSLNLLQLLQPQFRLLKQLMRGQRSSHSRLKVPKHSLSALSKLSQHHSKLLIKWSPSLIDNSSLSSKRSTASKANKPSVCKPCLTAMISWRASSTRRKMVSFLNSTPCNKSFLNYSDSKNNWQPNSKKPGNRRSLSKLKPTMIWSKIWTVCFRRWLLCSRSRRKRCSQQMRNSSKRFSKRRNHLMISEQITLWQISCHHRQS